MTRARRLVATGAAVAAAVVLARTDDTPAQGVERGIALLQDALALWTEKSVDVGQAAVSVCGTLKDGALALMHGDSSPPASLAQSAVSRARDWSEHPAKRRTLVVVGGRLLLDWLLRRAAGQPSPDQLAAEAAVCNLLCDDVTAAALLGLEGAVPRLLHLLARSEDCERLAQCLERGAAATSFPASASLDDLREAIAMVSGHDGLPTQAAAAHCLARWAQASVLNCGKIASMQGGPALSRCLAAAGREPGGAALAAHAMQAMAVLARDCPLRSLLGMDAWLQQLLFLAADAAAAGSPPLVVRALDCFAACLAHSEGLDPGLQAPGAWPLLRQLSALPDADVRRSVTLAVAALSRRHLPEAQRTRWAALLLGWLCGGPQGGRLPLAEAGHAAAALAALSAAPGPAGLGVAAAWLGELLVALSRNVKTYSSIRVGGRDMVEEVTQDHVGVGPAFARSVAFELRGAYEPPPPWQEPPADMEAALRTAVCARAPERLTPTEAAAADAKLCRALKVLCALVSADEGKQRWLQAAGIVRLLQRLALETQADVEGPEDSPGAGMSMGTQRQCARLLAMVAAAGWPQELQGSAVWLRWLRASARSPDCKLSSHAARALLHLQSARAFRPPVGQAVDLASLPEDSSDSSGRSSSSSSGDSSGSSGSSSSSRPAGRRLVIPDGVHLFDPQAAHHAVLAQHGADSAAEGAPALDLVFVHGIRGGPFASWRSLRTGSSGSSSSSSQPGGSGSSGDCLTHAACWPSEWLAADVPGARLLSLEYAAPASGWEGESLPLRGTVGQLMDKLAAAGVGARPCIFVCHSMGGILTKELLAKALASSAGGGPEQQSRRRGLAAATAGLVFFATPHSGSWLADVGWTLRFVGASPAASVLHLRPGKHLEEVDNAIRQLHSEGGVPVLSFGEGAPTAVAAALPQLLVVPEASAFPGYGRFVLLQGVDHINACKPLRREDPAYAETLAFVRAAAERCSAAEQPDTQPDAE